MNIKHFKLILDLKNKFVHKCTFKFLHFTGAKQCLLSFALLRNFGLYFILIGSRQNSIVKDSWTRLHICVWLFVIWQLFHVQNSDWHDDSKFMLEEQWVGGIVVGLLYLWTVGRGQGFTYIQHRPHFTIHS